MYLQSGLESYLVLLQKQICVIASAIYSVKKGYDWVLRIVL